MSKIVVTRHKALVEYLIAIGLVEETDEVVSHATVKDVQGKHVIGVLPLHLAAHAASVTVVPLRVPPELRGAELDLVQVTELAGAPETYSVQRLKGGSQ